MKIAHKDLGTLQYALARALNSENKALRSAQSRSQAGGKGGSVAAMAMTAAGLQRLYDQVTAEIKNPSGDSEICATEYKHHFPKEEHGAKCTKCGTIWQDLGVALEEQRRQEDASAG